MVQQPGSVPEGRRLSPTPELPAPCFSPTLSSGSNFLGSPGFPPPPLLLPCSLGAPASWRHLITVTVMWRTLSEPPPRAWLGAGAQVVFSERLEKNRAAGCFWTHQINHGGGSSYSSDTFLSSTYYVPGRDCIRPILQMRRLRLELGSSVRKDTQSAGGRAGT